MSKFFTTKQIFYYMKITAIQLIVIGLFASLSYARPSFGQEALKERISVSVKGSSLKNFLREIEKQTDISFSYQKEVTASKEKINADFKNQTVEEILKLVLTPREIQYQLIKKNQIILSRTRAPRSSLIPILRAVPSPYEKQIAKTVSGIVSDENGDVLPGVSVIVKGTTKGTTTKGDGSYSIMMEDRETTLIFSYVGMISQELNVANATTLNVTLKAGDKTLNEIVVVGYGTQKKGNLTGAVSSIKAEEISEIPAANLASTLAGRAPGLYITQSGGKPGKSSSINIRRYDGFGTARPPLFVIDGVIVDQFAFDGLDASEVENISVLKDGASSAVYGARAANGVIVVTTKKGAKGKPRINYVASYGIEEATKVPQTLSAYEEAMFTNDYLQQTDPNYLQNAAYYAQDELDYFKNNSFDLLKTEFIRPTLTRHALNVTGGNDRVSYFIGGAFYKGTGSFRNLEFEKYNVRAKVEAKITDNLSVSLNLSSDTRNDEKPYWRYDSDNDDFLDLYRNLVLRGKMSPAYLEYEGKQYPVGNLMKWHPSEVINGNSGYNRKTWTNYTTQVDLTYKVPFVKGLQLRALYSKYIRNDFRKEFNTPYKLYVFNSLGSKNHLVGNILDPSKTFERNDGNWIRETYQNSNFYQLNFFVNYDKSFGHHNLGGMFVYEQFESNNQNFSAQNQFFISTQLDQLSLGSSDSKDMSVSGGQLEDGRLSYIGRLNYSFKEQYFLEGSFRYEGSRYFVPEKRFGFFPSISAGWRISEAPFFKNNITFINDLKLRASFGKTGDDLVNTSVGNTAGALQWSQSYRKTVGAVFGGGTTNGVAPGTIPNPDITWAKKTTFNYGFDAGFFGNKLTASLDIYQNKRTDILGARTQSIPSTFGGTLPAVNYGRVDSKGVEVELAYRKNIRKDLSYFLSFNYGYATNKQVLIDEASNIRPFQSQLGRPTGGIFGQIATDIIRTQADLDALPAGYTINGATPRLGMLNFKDIRGATSEEPDGKIDANDREFIATFSSAPTTYGATIGGKWKGLSVDVFFQGLSGYKKVRQITWHAAQWQSQETGSFDYWRDHWTPSNPNAAYPLYSDLGGNGGTSTFWLEDASFIRLKNLNIGYDIPLTLTKKVGLENVKVFFNGVNLFLLKDRIKLYDPEGGINAYPINRSYTLGLNISL